MHKEEEEKKSVFVRRRYSRYLEKNKDRTKFHAEREKEGERKVKKKKRGRDERREEERNIEKQRQRHTITLVPHDLPHADYRNLLGLKIP